MWRLVKPRDVSAILPQLTGSAALMSRRFLATPGKVKVNITTTDGTDVSFEAKTGMTLMEAIRDIGKLDVEAACDGTCGCSTCHVYLDEALYNKLEAPSADELDMLDLAPDVQVTSRLSCQVTLTSEMDGIHATIPKNLTNQMM